MIHTIIHSLVSGTEQRLLVALACALSLSFYMPLAALGLLAGYGVVLASNHKEAIEMAGDVFLLTSRALACLGITYYTFVALWLVLGFIMSYIIPIALISLTVYFFSDQIEGYLAAREELVPGSGLVSGYPTTAESVRGRSSSVRMTPPRTPTEDLDSDPENTPQ